MHRRSCNLDFSYDGRAVQGGIIRKVLCSPNDDARAVAEIIVEP